MALLNLGILAHVDAGKTSLTERLLHDAGVIDEVGSVDDGSTQTDSLELERRRGITIKSAVVSFPVGDTTVTLIDTPGHPDFIAEVERVLGVLDGAVLVVSAVEGVQAEGDVKVGVNIVRRALEEPARQIANNAGEEGSVVVKQLLADNGTGGFNAATGKYEDLVAAGVIDPAKVTKTALINAASIAGLMLTTEALVCEIKEKDDNKGGGGAGMPGGGMGGMY